MFTTADPELEAKRLRLLKGLAAATEEGRIVWDDTSEDDTLVAQIGSSAVRVMDEFITRSLVKTESQFCRITIFDVKGKIVDDFIIDLSAGFSLEIKRATTALRGAMIASLDKTASRRLDAVLEEIGA